MFEGGFTDTYANKIPLMSMGGPAEGLMCADSVARTTIGVKKILHTIYLNNQLY